MKKYICLFLLAFAAMTSSFAQTQQGIVKTRGRVVDGKIVPGTKLSGVTITLNFGNPLISGNQGEFSFAVRASKSYSLVSVSKLGYVLADPEFLKRTFSYSADNTFFVVLDDENQRQADINAATRKVRNALLSKLAEQEEEIEHLKEQNKLTEKGYQERLQKLYENQAQSEQLIGYIAEQYAAIDYDQLDDFNRQVQMCIENGELHKADSIIRSKGDLNRRVTEYHDIVSENIQIRKKLRQQETGAARIYEDLSQDLYRCHEIYLHKFQQDSALYCLKVRAELDSMRTNAIWDYAQLCFQQRKMSEAEAQYKRLLNSCLQNGDILKAAELYNNLGKVNDFLDNDSLCVNYYMQSIETYQLNKSLSPKEKLSLVSVYLDLALRLSQSRTNAIDRRKEALLLCEEAEQILEEINDLGTIDSKTKFIQYQLQIGSIYRNVLAYTKLEEIFSKSGHWTPVFLNDRYALQEKIENSISAAKKGLCISSINDESELPRLAYIYTLFYHLYHIIQKDEMALESLMESKRIYEQLYEQNPSAYRESLAHQYYYLLYLTDSKYKRYYTDKAFSLFSESNKLFPGSYSEELYFLLIDEYYYAMTDKNYLQAVEFAREMVNLGKPNGFLPSSLVDLSLWYIEQQQYETAMECIDEAIQQGRLEYDKILDEPQFPDKDERISSACKRLCRAYDAKGEILLTQGKLQEAEEIWKIILKLNPDYLNDNLEGTNFTNGLKEMWTIKE